MKNNFEDVSQHLLILGAVWPEPQSSAAGKRMMQLISLFQSNGWKITFASSAAESEHMADLSAKSIDSVAVRINDSAFDEFLQKLQPTVVMFDRFMVEEQFGWRVAQYCPNALRVLDTEDLHSLRKTRQQAARKGEPFSKEDMLSEEIAMREIASIMRCDLSLIISEAEMQLLQDVFEVSPDLLHYLPFLLDPIDEAEHIGPAFQDRRHFITVGNFLHAPNRDAVHYLKKEIWPLIKDKLPDAELHIYGAYPTQDVQQLHKPSEGFLVKGRVGEVRPVVEQARVCLAPLRFGAGLKGKLVEAMQCGTPSVTTEIGAEGMPGELPWNGRIVNDPQKFTSAAVELYTSEHAWNKAMQNGAPIINQRFNIERFGAELIQEIKDKQQYLDNFRRQNFTGSMLMHHTMAASKYMSRWIEAKNKNNV